MQLLVVGGGGLGVQRGSCSAGRRTPRARGRRRSRSSSPARPGPGATQSVDADVSGPPLGRRERVGELAEEAARAARIGADRHVGGDRADESLRAAARAAGAARSQLGRRQSASAGEISLPPARRSAGAARPPRIAVELDERARVGLQPLEGPRSRRDRLSRMREQGRLSGRAEAEGDDPDQYAAAHGA